MTCVILQSRVFSVPEFSVPGFGYRHYPLELPSLRPRMCGVCLWTCSLNVTSVTKVSQKIFQVTVRWAWCRETCLGNSTIEPVLSVGNIARQNVNYTPFDWAVQMIKLCNPKLYFQIIYLNRPSPSWIWLVISEFRITCLLEDVGLNYRSSFPGSNIYDIDTS